MLLLHVNTGQPDLLPQLNNFIFSTNMVSVMVNYDI